MMTKGFFKMIVDCYDNCEFCLKFKKPFSWPVVRFPVSDRFNEFVSMDLKKVEKKDSVDTSLDWCSHKIHSCLFDLKKEKRVSSASYISDMGGLFWSNW